MNKKAIEYRMELESCTFMHTTKMKFEFFIKNKNDLNNPIKIMGKPSIPQLF